MTGTQLLTEPSSRRHHIQSSFLLFTDYTVFDLHTIPRGQKSSASTLTKPFFYS